MTTAPAAPGTSARDLVAAARDLQPLLRENAAAGEDSGRLTDAVVEALHDSGLFGMWAPTTFGGAELDPVSSLDVISALAEADPSAAWVLMAANVATGSAGAYLPDEAAATVFGKSAPRFPVIAGQGTRPGTAVPDGDGFRLSGSWSFASGIKHGQWIHTMGAVEDTGEARIFILPVEQATLIDNWDVMGLRATGSIDYVIEDLPVPAAFTHLGATEEPLRGGTLWRLGIIQLAIVGHSAWALGVSRRMLDDLAELVRAKAGRPGTLADSLAFQTVYGEAEARWYAARAYVYETWREVSAAIDAGVELTQHQRTMVRLALYNATWSAEQICDTVYRAAGTTALRAGDMQRFFRDMHAGTQHVTSAPGVVEGCGRFLAGLVPNPSWMFLSLVPGDQKHG